MIERKKPGDRPAWAFAIVALAVATACNGLAGGREGRPGPEHPQNEAQALSGSSSPADEPPDHHQGLTEEIAPKPPHGLYQGDGESRIAALPDRGIWTDLDARTSIRLLTGVGAERGAIVVDKARRLLTVLVDQTAVAAYPVALGFEPLGDKQRRGDGRTPEGSYHICELLDEDLAPRYGARSMRLSYPNAKDAARGASAGLIDRGQRRAIERAIAEGRMPPQDTELGSSIRIHGGGIGKDWTAGCIALRDVDVVDVYGAVEIGTAVRVLGSGEALPFGDRDRDGIADQVDGLLGAKKTVLNAAEYDGRYVSIPSPNGDVPREIGVCTDVIVRALRNAGLDLQAEVQADRARSPKSYPRMAVPNSSIDHRRVKNLAPWFERNWRKRPAGDFNDYLPGDVVLMDTLPNAGADHIGIVSDRRGDSGRPLVINNWTVGYSTAEMDLLGWVEVTARYRWPG
jgi:uncharacterized protein YijF (DUF1287 family)/lipoprotein-anchoring transpeptidase ErfK/SrfK